MHKYLIILLIVITLGCSSTQKRDYVFFGGKIINPKSDYVLLCKELTVIDSIKINGNSFKTKLKNITPGLYYFKHGVEHQYVYLESNDSLLIRLNTWDFDKSLMFSGTGANRNNLLIDAFLENEKVKKEFIDYYNLPPKEFKSKIDTLAKYRQQKIDNFIKTNPNSSKDFIEISQIALQYPVYTKLENYVRENFDNTDFTIDSSFITHKKNIDINRASLMCYIPYRNYVYANLYSNVNLKKIPKNTCEFTIELLKNIDKTIIDEKQRNRLLRHITVRHFYNNPKEIVHNDVFSTFLNLSKNERDKQHISDLFEDIRKIEINKNTPFFSIVSPDGSINSIHKITKNKKTLIYFKGKSRYSDDWLASRINFLSNEYPNIDFLVVNVDKNRDKYNKLLPINQQFSLTKNSKANQFLNSKFPRAILINEHGIVKNNFASLSSHTIVNQLASL